MPTCTTIPTLHPGALHPGPALTIALKGRDKPGKEKSPKGSRRARWDERHHVTWKNDYQNTNMRSYFDRFVDRVDIPVCPRPRLRPTWVVDVPAAEDETQVHRVFDPVNATFKDQWRWELHSEDTIKAALRLVDGAKQSPEQSSKRKLSKSRSSIFRSEDPAPAASSSPTPPVAKTGGPPKPRTPRRPADLRAQRNRESEWDARHGVVFSRFNDGFQRNVRSYFDRWKDDEGGGHSRDPTWRLQPERRSPLDKRSRSETSMRALVGPSPIPGRPAWEGSF